MQRNILLLLWLVIGMFTSISAYAKVNILLQKEIQKSVVSFQKSSGAPAIVMSIKQGDQVAINFVSGTTLKRTWKNWTPPKVTISSLFQIGSITKNFAAAKILQLEAQGKITINETIAETIKKYGQWLPTVALEAWSDITIKQLLNMTSGIYNVTENKELLTEVEKDPTKQMNINDILHTAYSHRPYFKPGKGYHYSDTNYIIIGLLIQAITKQTVSAALSATIFKPLKLTNTYYIDHAYSPAIYQRMAHGYGFVYLVGEGLPTSKVGKDMTRFNLSMAGAAGAMVSTTEDLVVWTHALFTGKVIPKQQLQEMQQAVCVGLRHQCESGKPLASDSHAVGYGLGISRFYVKPFGECWTYLGGTPGYYALIFWSPKYNLAIAVTTNATTIKSQKLLPLVLKTALLLTKQKQGF